MRELRFEGLSQDGSALVLAGNDGQRYTVVIDERLEAAVRRDRARMSQVELEQAGVLRPREIQARIRAGATAEDVAAASGLPLEHIRRFEGPVLTERAWVAQQAMATEVRRPTGDIELGRLVADRLGSIGVDPDDIAWDAWRGDDGLWVVIATFPVAPNTHVATWTYDSGGRTMTIVDDNARALSAIDADAPLELAPPRPTLTAVAPVAEFLDEDPDAPTPATILSGGTVVTEDRPGDPDAPAGLVVVGDAAETTDGSDSSESDSTDSAEVAGESPLVDGAAAEAVQTAEPSAEALDLSSLDDLFEEPATTPVAAEPVGIETDEPAHDDAADPIADAQDAALFETPEPPARPAGKPHIPSFDDILFGPGR